MFITEELYPGPDFTFKGVLKDGKSLLRPFLDSLPEADSAQCYALIKLIGDHGIPHNKEKFRKESKNIYALKTSNIRIYCFFAGKKIIILTHGLKKNAKGGEKVQRKELELAEKIRVCLSPDQLGNS